MGESGSAGSRGRECRPGDLSLPMVFGSELGAREGERSGGPGPMEVIAGYVLKHYYSEMTSAYDRLHDLLRALRGLGSKGSTSGPRAPAGILRAMEKRLSDERSRYCARFAALAVSLGVALEKFGRLLDPSWVAEEGGDGLPVPEWLGRVERKLTGKKGLLRASLQEALCGQRGRERPLIIDLADNILALVGVLAGPARAEAGGVKEALDNVAGTLRTVKSALSHASLSGTTYRALSEALSPLREEGAGEPARGRIRALLLEALIHGLTAWSLYREAESRRYDIPPPARPGLTVMVETRGDKRRKKQGSGGAGRAAEVSTIKIVIKGACRGGAPRGSRARENSGAASMTIVLNLEGRKGSCTCHAGRAGAARRPQPRLGGEA